MQHEAVLIFQNADRNTEFHRATCLAFRDPPRVRPKEGEHLFAPWDRLAFEKVPVAPVDLPHSVREEGPVFVRSSRLGSPLQSTPEGQIQRGGHAQRSMQDRP